MDDAHQRIQAAVAAFARGEILIVADDDDRENEGDLFVAASLCTPEKMAFIIRNTSGIVCAPLAPDPRTPWSRFSTPSAHTPRSDRKSVV
jgi:3,4-dihydroxy 2-butanone 4-phosphate synthase/GTP cyclohydrolase II